MEDKTFLIGTTKNVHVRVTKIGVTIRLGGRKGRLLVDASLLTVTGNITVRGNQYTNTDRKMLETAAFFTIPEARQGWVE